MSCARFDGYTYDRPAWSFIQSTLKEVGFNQEWVRNVTACISTSRLAITLNGKTSDWFKPSRGIRQGNPISPLLFVLCIEQLSNLIEDLVLAGEWRVIKITKNRPVLKHLLFADDMLMFHEATSQQANTIKQSLDSFCSQPGQRVNC